MKPYKYTLEFGENTLQVGLGAKFLHVGYQEQHHPHLPTIWMEVNDKAPSSNRRFIVVGAGMEIPEDCIHVGSCQCGPYVWHVYTPNAEFAKEARHA